MRERWRAFVPSPPVAKLRVPDSGRGFSMSRSEKRAMMQGQFSLFPGYGGPCESVHRDLRPLDEELDDAGG